MAKANTNSTNNAKKNLERYCINESDSIDKALTKLSKLGQVQLQNRLNQSIDRPTAFTKRALGFKYFKGSNGSTNRIFMMPNQAKYLDKILLQSTGTTSTKFRPFNLKTKLNHYGNITGLNRKSNFTTTKIDGKKALVNKRNVVTGILKTAQYKPVMDYRLESNRVVQNIKRRLLEIKKGKRR